MDFQTIIVGLLTAGLVELAKRWQAIPLSPTNKNAIRITAGVLSLLGVVGVKMLDGSISDTSFLQTIAQAAVSYGMSWLTYKSAIK